jgi:hypothetical protein
LPINAFRDRIECFLVEENTHVRIVVGVYKFKILKNNMKAQLNEV